MIYEITRLASKNGDDTLKINEYFIHSKYDPKGVAFKFISSHYKRNHLHILFGYGLGYEVDVLLQKGTKVLVVDPLITKNKLMIKEEHTNNINFYYWGTECINSLAYNIATIKNVVELKINTLSLTKYEVLFPNEYRNLLQEIRDYQVKASINQVTVIHFAEQWQRNLIKNLNWIATDLGAGELIQKFNVPIILASGGPSLTKQLPLLKKYEDYVIIMAVGSTINSLLAADITPDFVISIDGGIPNYNHFKNIKSDKIRLIYSVFNHYGIRQSFSKKAYAFANFQQGTVSKYVRQNLDVALPLLFGGGTVAHSAYSIAHMIDSGPIAMIGQDLAYTNNQSHAENNALFEKVDLKISNREIVKTIGYYDEEIYTSESFYSMKTTFEEVVRLHEPKQPIFNCTEGGVKIVGMDQMPFKQFLEANVNVDIKKDLSVLDELEKYSKDIDVIEVLEKELDKGSEFKTTLTGAIIALEQNLANDSFDENTLLKLEVFDDIIREQARNLLIQYLIQPIIIEVETLFLEKENETAEEAYLRVFNQTKTLYERLIEACSTSEKYIQEKIEELKAKGEN